MNVETTMGRIAAIAANLLSKHGKTAILDIDFHAGNGTQDIFYERSDVLVVSLHADPDREYPYFAGFTYETGSGDGIGFHHNFPLPTGIKDKQYLLVLDQALNRVNEFQPDYLVLSAGMDIYKDDPIGDFDITREGIRQIGERISHLLIPTTIVMEGGYHLPTFAENFTTLIEAFIQTITK